MVVHGRSFRPWARCCTSISVADGDGLDDFVHINLNVPREGKLTERPHGEHDDRADHVQEQGARFHDGNTVFSEVRRIRRHVGDVVGAEQHGMSEERHR